MHRIEELRKQGLWSIRRLPKIQEPVRPKVHWDYLLEEMEWLASDFHHEARFKRTGTKKVAFIISSIVVVIMGVRNFYTYPLNSHLHVT